MKTIKNNPQKVSSARQPYSQKSFMQAGSPQEAFVADLRYIFHKYEVAVMTEKRRMGRMTRRK